MAVARVVTWPSHFVRHAWGFPKMLDVALQFLKESANEYILARTGADFGNVELSRVVDDAGKWVIPENRIGIALINVEEERLLKSQVPETTLVNGRRVAFEPSLRLNLHVIFAANFRQYDQALRCLSHILTFFQSHGSFDPIRYPSLDARIEKLLVELQTLSYEQLNQVWSFIGSKQLPAVFYKVRLVVLQDRAEPAISVPITTIEGQANLR